MYKCTNLDILIVILTTYKGKGTSYTLTQYWHETFILHVDACVAQSVRAFAPQADGWEFEQSGDRA